LSSRSCLRVCPAHLRLLPIPVSVPSLSIMSVDLHPAELGFRRNLDLSHCRDLCSQYLGPFDHEVTEALRLTNTNTSPVAFKVASIRFPLLGTADCMIRSKPQLPSSTEHRFISLELSTNRCRYCVRPNSGIIPANGNVEVQGMRNLDRYRTYSANLCSSSSSSKGRPSDGL
jgi:hypothetical protein